ncbi:MAG: DUF4405 domain-containing protein [Planctomycetota bacterium]|jgi:hypothetical protein
MKRNTVNFWIDVISFLPMLGLTWTGLLMHYVLPPGTGGRHSDRALTVWGLGRHDYGTVHFYLALALVGLIVIHLWLHWSWVCATVRKLAGKESSRGGREGVYGIAALAVVVTLVLCGLLLARSQVKSGSRVIAPKVIEHDTSSSFQISGQTTLAQAARIGGMPVEELIAKLRLPADVNMDEQLGRLKRQYGFEIHDVRNILQQRK